MGHAIVVPTVNIPEGNVTAKATDLSGNVSDASAPMLYQQRVGQQIPLIMLKVPLLPKRL